MDKEGAYQHLKRELPFLANLFEATGEQPLPVPSHMPVGSALAEIVAGQMLSRRAAQAIIERMKVAAAEQGVRHPYELSEAALRGCGLSSRKASTVVSIGALASRNSEMLESWRSLDWSALRAKVSSISGLGNWSAAMLAIFHFAVPDVFPERDGSLVRAIQKVQVLYPFDEDVFPHGQAAPYRSYLAISLWYALDNGHLDVPA